MRKKMLSFVLALMMCLSLMPSAFAAEAKRPSDKFTDVPANAWYKSELDYAVANGYIAGTSDTTFSPDASITRAQFVTILGRMLTFDFKAGSYTFEDVEAGSWYAPYVGWAASRGYVNGYSSKEFGPNNVITVEQMGTILANYINKSGVTLWSYQASPVYADASSISGWAKSNMELVRQYGLMVTDASGKVNPQKTVSRAEGTVSLVRLAKAMGMGKDPGATPDVIVTNPSGTKTYYYSIMSEEDIACLEVVIRAYNDLHESGMITDTTPLKDRTIYYAWWLTVHSGYDNSYSLPNRHTAYGALVEGKAVCDGLAYAYKMLMDYEGIECVFVPDYEARHAYNEVLIDGAWYEVDPQQVGSLSGNPDGSFSQRGFDRMYQKYLTTPVRYEG